uniref:Uncharacterized protein n=1 Tax=Oryza punctata TaxID=4537 RepID=A0A0E0LVU8_ORYPU
MGSRTAALSQRKRKAVRSEKRREEEVVTSRQPGSGTPSTGVGVRLGSRSLIDAAANSNPPCPTEARLVASRSGASSGAAANAHGGRGQW